MNHWAFVAAAYGVTGAATVFLLLSSWLAMRRAERDLDAVAPRSQ